MSAALQKVLNWGADIKNGRWPGAAVRISSGTRAGEIDFRKGRVVNVTDLAILVDIDHPLYTAVKLMGASYAHYCEACTRTIPGHVTYQRSAGSIEHNGFDLPIRFFCPYCGPDALLRELRPGDKMRLHYRFEQDYSSGSWFGEVWDW